MADLKVGDRVRVKDQKDWPSPPGYRFAGSEGTVGKWVEWEEPLKDFQDYVYVKIDKSTASEYIGASLFFEAANLEKI